jgi:hypothetical protein
VDHQVLLHLHLYFVVSLLLDNQVLLRLHNGELL